MDRPRDLIDERWQDVDRIFAAALELPAHERRAFVATECGDDDALRETVTRLLASTADPVLTGPGTRLLRAAFRVPDPESAAAVAEGERIGSYVVTRELGRGGMGTVYLAERAGTDFEQQVAIKVLRRGLDTDDVVRRFIGERRILAGLDHPSIARLIDGGSTDDGRPYFVMEYVEGTTLTKYVETNALPLRKRLELFLRVADAVRYAHTKLVVHRDLKPSNIMVTADGRVKLLDFGIAKLLAPGADDGGLTRTGVSVLTPEYASPEQLRGDTITTASDVYQLGSLLYVLLTGRRPFERPRGAATGEAERIAPPPSAAVSDDAQLRRALSGDLDTIVVKALREEPERRYESVAQLAGDVRAHLEGRPVSARPDTLRYRTGKLLRRHVWIAPTAALGLLFAFVYVVSSIRHTAALERERNAARAEAERAGEVTELLLGLFRSPDPFAPADPERGRAITVVEALDRGTQRVLEEMDDRPRIQVSLLDALAEVYTNLGVADRALPPAERALALREELDGVPSAEYRAALGRLATIVGAVNLGDSALVLFRRRLQHTLEAGAPAAEIAESHVDLAAHLKHWVDQPAEAEAEYLRALAVADSAYVEIETLAEAHRGLSDIYVTLGRAVDAEPHARRAVELHRQKWGDDSPNTAMGHESLAAVLGSLGRMEEAAAESQRAIDILDRTLGSDHGITVNALNNRALLLRQNGDLAGAERALRRVLDASLRVRGQEHREVATVLQNLATAIADQGRIEEAASLHRRAAEMYERTLAPGSWLGGLPWLSLAGLELKRRNASAAESHARRALEILETALPPGHYATAVARCRVGRSLLAQGRIAEGLPLLREAAEALSPDTPVPAYREECLAALEEAGGS